MIVIPSRKKFERRVNKQKTFSLNDVGKYFLFLVLTN